ncbi:MAG TPA: response regulator [Candidatus Polarisedimenticolia bacterium]|nr:response regulator [Candidatus Polarisedimenticolia bacterium]
MKTILLADDSITIQKVVELTFSEADYRVICVSTGGQAIKKVAETRPDIVLLDVIMPEKNGYEVCEQLKRNPSTRGIPVLLLTGTFEPFDKKRADAAGANGHVTKPFESQVLVGKVEELIAATPAVSTDDQGGQMDIISGGDIYHVDPGRAADGLRASHPAPTASTPGPDAPAPGESVLPPSPLAPALPPYSAHAPDREAEDREEGTRPHPAMAPPDPAAGGSYVGFADLGMAAGMDGEVVPDRFDDPESATTRSLRRDEAARSRGDHAKAAGGAIGAASGALGTEDAFHGSFEQEFDLVDEVPAGGPATAGEDEGPAWTPPPEAPPAETWQSMDDLSAGEGPDAGTGSTPPAPSPTPMAPTVAGKGVALTPEMIDLIADRVVERLADRVVREIAWEVVPGVAETLVRRRIKELEDSHSG